MAKVYLPNFAICILSFVLNLLVLGIYPFAVIALDSSAENNNKEALDNSTKTIESAILSEINRVRTNPQGYASWLESQRQYYDGVWLKLPGEEAVRTNKGLKALNEAIAFLKQQQPLSPLNPSDVVAANANNKLKNFSSSNNIQNISYGRKTPQGIVMSLVVDELFPDRRRRQSLLNPDSKNTGVICQNDSRYHKICAIAYSDSITETVAAKPQTPPPPTEIPENTTIEPEANVEKTETVEETLPQPPQVPPTPPTTENSTDSTRDQEESTVIAEEEKTEEQEIETIETQPDIPEEEKSEENLQEETNVETEPEEPEIVEEKPEESEETIATNSNNSPLLENVERGTLEEGDRVITDDGSFYDSFPLEGKAGESFTISLESDEFDPFVALIDDKGNIIEQNDDINEENSNSRIRVTLPEDGVYNVIVNAYDEGGTGQYVLTVSR